MATSRSPLKYLQRKELEPSHFPRPRFAPCDLLVHKYETGFSELKGRQAEGDPPPDRARLKPWAPESE